MDQTYTNDAEIAAAFTYLGVPPQASTLTVQATVNHFHITKTMLSRFKLVEGRHFARGIGGRRVYKADMLAVYIYRLLRKRNQTLPEYREHIMALCRAKSKAAKQSETRRILSILRDATEDKPKARAFIAATLAEHGITL